MNEIQEQVTEDWITTMTAAKLGCTYWHFVRKVLPSWAWQPAGNTGCDSLSGRRSARRGPAMKKPISLEDVPKS